MHLLSRLARILVRQIVGVRVEDAAAAVQRCFAVHTQALPRALAWGNENAWKALGIVLSGDDFDERIRPLLAVGEEENIRQHARRLLAGGWVSFADKPPEFRQQCLANLIAARTAAGPLATSASGPEAFALGEGGLQRDAGPQEPIRAATNAVAEAAAALEPDYPQLAELLCTPTGGGPPLLASLFAYFFGRAVANDSELAEALLFEGRRQVFDNAQDMLLGLRRLWVTRAETFETIEHLIVLLGEHFDEMLIGTAAGAAELDLQPGRQGEETHPDAPGPVLAPEDGLMDSATDGPASERPSDSPAPPPAANSAAPANDEAGARYDAYQAALLRRDWDTALAELQAAVRLDVERFAPFRSGKFEPLRILGAGGFGTAILCRNVYEDSRVVVKAIRMEAEGLDPARVFREARVLRGMDHPAIIKLLDCDFADTARTRPYLVMDYFEGPTLSEYVREHGSLDPDELLPLARQVAEGLQAAHTRGILHRDVKPGNILVRRQGPRWQVKLIDFGLSHQQVPVADSAGTPRSDRTSTGRGWAGTQDYAAPEQVGKAAMEVGPYSDVYGFGRTCCYALFKTPYPGPRQWRSLPEGLADLLGDCTAEAPEERPRDFAVVLERLGRQKPTADVEKIEDTAASPPHPSSADAEAELAAADELGSAQEYFNRGKEYQQNGELGKAIADLTRALELNPQWDLAHAARGETYRLKGDYGAAIADLDEAIRLKPRWDWAHYTRGETFRLRGEYIKAIADLDEAIRLNPKWDLAYASRGEAHRQKGDYDRAIIDLTQALRLNPRRAWAFGWRGEAYRLKGDFDRAIADFNQAMQLYPRYAWDYYCRGEAFRCKGEIDQAIADFSEAAKLNPQWDWAFYSRARLYHQRGAYDLAIADFTEAISLNSEWDWAYYGRAEAYRHKNEFESALADLTEALRLSPKWAWAYGRRADVHRLRGDYNSAIADLTEALRLNPLWDWAYANRGKAHQHQGQYREALADFTEAIRLKPDWAWAHASRGEVHRMLGDHDHAISDFDEALRLKPDWDWAYACRGETYRLQGDYDQAIADFSEALRLNPYRAWAFGRRGEVYRQKQDLDRAIADFSAAIRLYPRYAWHHFCRGEAYHCKGDFEKAVADLNEALRLNPTLTLASEELQKVNSQLSAR